MIFDHGVRSVGGVARVRVRAFLSANPRCAWCPGVAVGVVVAADTGVMTAVCAGHFGDPGGAGGGDRS